MTIHESEEERAKRPELPEKGTGLGGLYTYRDLEGQPQHIINYLTRRKKIELQEVTQRREILEVLERVDSKLGRLLFAQESTDAMLGELLDQGPKKSTDAYFNSRLMQAAREKAKNGGVS